MKLLFLAPQPFFQDRGTPIAVRLAVEVLAKRKDLDVDLLTYHEGRAVELPNVSLNRSELPKWATRLGLKNIGPGISLKKLLCDIFFFISVGKLLWANRKQQYDLIHSVEESVFIAWIVHRLFGIPYIYDMDSSMAMQVVEKWWILKPLSPILQFFEKIAVTSSMAVVPVCDALAAIADRHGSKDTHILRDISLLDLSSDDNNGSDKPSNLREHLALSSDDILVLYIGNLETYQGVNLLADSFVKAASSHSSSHLIIIGGKPEHIEELQRRVDSADMQNRIHLMGSRPVAHLSSYLKQADILASPRTKGNNTPMKIYSYLHSNKPTIATDLPTHTQVLDSDVAMLAKPQVLEFSTALLQLLQDGELRERLASNAFKLAEREYTYEVFQSRLNELYDRVDSKVSMSHIPSPKAS